MRRLVGITMVCLLLVLAGCSAIPGTGGNSGSNDGPPPGISDDGLVNGTELIQAHTASLAETGFAHDARVNATVVRRDQLTRVQRNQTTTVTAAGPYRRSLVNADTGFRVDVWANETTQVYRSQVGDRTAYRTGDPEPIENLTGRFFLRPYVGGPFTVESVDERQGRNEYTLVSDAPPTQPAFPPEWTDIRNYQARLVVDTDGRIRHLSVTADYTINDQDARLDIKYELTRVGVDSVDRPAWVDEA